MSAVLAQPSTDRHAIIAKAVESIREGKTFGEIAIEVGIPARTLNHWLLSAMPDEYREAQETGIVGKLLDASDEIENADSPLRVTRAREFARFWQWVAERRHRSFAPKAEVSGPGGGPIQLETIERARRAAFLKTIDAEVVQSSSDPAADSGTGLADHNL